MVDELFSAGEFPAIEHLIGANVLERCWMERYTEIGAMIQDQNSTCKKCEIHGVLYRRYRSLFRPL